LALEGLTTPVTPALNAGDPVLGVALPLLLLPLLLLQALMTRAASAPTAVVARVLRLFMR
jgi:hypothetical protein